MKEYRIVTKKSLYDIEDGSNYEKELSELYEMQNEFIDFNSIKYYISKITGNDNKEYIFLSHSSLEELTQCLAIKDGIDVVRVQDDSLAIISYYNGKIEMLEFREISSDLHDSLFNNNSKKLDRYFIESNQ